MRKFETLVKGKMYKKFIEFINVVLSINTLFPVQMINL